MFTMCSRCVHDMFTICSSTIDDHRKDERLFISVRCSTIQLQLHYHVESIPPSLSKHGETRPSNGWWRRGPRGAAEGLAKSITALAGASVLGYTAYQSVYTVQGRHRAVGL